MLNRSRYALAAAVLVLAGVAFLTRSTQAQPDDCVVTSSPDYVEANSDVTYQFNVTNDDPTNQIDWVMITTPTSSFNIVSTQADGWNSYVDSAGAEFNDGTLGPGDSLNFNVEIQTGPFQAGQMDWGIYSFNDSDSNGPGNLQCQNNTPTDMIDNTPYISDVSPSDVTTNSVVISWTTTLPATSQVDYGLDDTYGNSSPIDNSLVTSHAVTLTGLTANTGYHYQVESTTPAGGDDVSGDNTFLTAEQQVVVTPTNNSGSSSFSSPYSSTTSGTTSSNTNSPIGITVTKPTDNTPPKISFTNLSTINVFKTAPTLTGQASDSIAVQRVEYSTDGGQNWLPVNSAPNLNTAQTTFSFTPVNLPDGTYKFMARAVNDGGYITATSAVTIVIDSLPPIVGGNILSIGPQVLVPSSSGVITSITGVDQKITMSSVGGPTTIDLTAQKIDVKTSSAQVFGLTESPETLLWSGVVSIASQGEYRLVANAVDGAGVKTAQVVGTLNIMRDPYTYNQMTHRSVPSVITLYYLDPDSHSWVVWDGSSYDQTNPQTTDSHGNFKLFVPPGTYYLQATASGYETLISSIFKTSQSEPLTTDLGLKPLQRISLGPVHLSLPTLAIQNVNLNPRISTTLGGIQSGLVGQPLPDFTLTDTNGSTVHTADLLGKPTLITLGSTWAPTMDEQLSILSRLQTNQNLNIVPIALQQNAGQVEAYTSIAGLNLSWLVDPDSTLTPEFGAPNLPTQLFVDRNGIVKQVYVGGLSQSQIMNTLSGLE
jgi:peroxiredoxin